MERPQKMMNYYERKENAIKMIKKFCEGGRLTEEQINFEILMRYSLSDRFTGKIIDKFIDFGICQRGLMGEIISLVKEPPTNQPNESAQEEVDRILGGRTGLD